jgi:hypothetical protein
MLAVGTRQVIPMSFGASEKVRTSGYIVYLGTIGGCTFIKHYKDNKKCKEICHKSQTTTQHRSKLEFTDTPKVLEQRHI